MTRFDALVGMIATAGLVAFWVPEIWNYGYIQVIAGQLSAALAGVFLWRFTTAGR